MTVKILLGDCRDVLKTLPDQSVHCCVTSPPYWGLRSYLPADHPNKHREIGSEPTVEQWVHTMVEVFREVRRVLRDDGTCFVNLGDSYNTGTSATRQDSKTADHGDWANGSRKGGRRANVPDLKPKDLVGQPWLFAFALRADGWWLRQEVIWSKKNPMPESARDRFTKAHETVFLLTKSQRYYWDFEAVQERASEGTNERRAVYKTPDGWDTSNGEGGHGSFHKAGREKGHIPGNKNHTAAALYEAGDEKHRTKGGLVKKYAERQRKLAQAGEGTKNNDSFDEAMAVMPATRNPRDVRIVDEDEWLQFLRWKAEQPIAPDVLHLASEPFRGAHFATYPPKLIRPFILAGCPPGGVVLDIFGGSGTTGLVADQEGRDAILIDLDERNEPMAERRIQADKWNADKRTPSLFDTEVQA